MGSAWSSTSGEVQTFSTATAYAERRSSSALLDKGFAALERDFEASNRRVELPEREDFLGAADFHQLESPAVSPYGSDQNMVHLNLIWMDGSVIELKISLTATCDDVTSLLQRRGVISTGLPRLLLGTSLLEGDTRLFELGISDGSELQLILSRPCLSLDASDNNLGGAGLEALVDGLREPLQRVYLLRTGLCGKAGGQAVARLVRASPGLEYLDLSGNNGFGAVSLGDSGIDLKALASEIHSSYSLVHVSLADCSLEGLLGGQELACLLYKAPNLQHLDVHSNNNLGPSGVAALSEALSELSRPVKLSSVSLEDTGLEEQTGGEATAVLLHQLPFLTTLNISNNLLLAEGLGALAKGMPDPTRISRLDARNVGLPCDLGLQEAEIFGLILEKSPRLKFVDSEGHSFDGPPEFQEMLSHMELLQIPGHLDHGELPELSELIRERPLAETALKLLTGMGVQQLQKLRFFNLSSVSHALQLGGSVPGAQEGILLVKLLDAMPSLEHLSFNASCLGAAWTSGVGQIFLESLRDTGIKRHWNEAFSIRLQLTSLKSIDFGDCSLHADAGRMLAELLHLLPQLRSLSLARNHRLENAGVQAFAEGLQSRELEESRHSLAELDLSCCSIAAEQGAAAIIVILQNLREMQVLSVSSNPGLGSHIGALFEHVICNTQISSLNCASCGISASVGLNLQSSRSRCLTSLDISGNTEIGPVGLKSFTSQLPKMNLQRLNLADCGLESRAGGDSIAALLSQCKSNH